MTEASTLPLPRLAICGNVFPGDALTELTAALERVWLPLCQEVAGARISPDFGLYLGQAACAPWSALGEGSMAQLQRDLAPTLRQLLVASGSALWTANAFPLGGFHGATVKEAAFRPAWDQPSRLQYTLQVAQALLDLADPPRGSRLSISTCPLGYGADPWQEERGIAQLRQVTECFAALEQEHGILLQLALEPEPDGRLESGGALAAWLATHFSRDERRYLGLCWDICHGEVVGEAPAELLASCRRLEVPIAKVQVSAALEVADASHPEARRRLELLAQDRYFHQVRGHAADGSLLAYPDLPQALADPRAAAASWRIHCHVPVHLEDLGDGLRASRWRPAVAAAMAAGLRDFELETYTLPFLPADLRPQGLVETMAAEWRAVADALGLTAA